ncbi:MAG: C25 family cysteine peptidase [Bacteroidota bacterium]
MIKRLLILCSLICLTVNLTAQKYGNEWINYGQKHYRISIPKTGLYRIDYNTLLASGIPLSTINPKNFQLFIKGNEQYITINGESDNVFNPTDYIEFFAKKNDASFDSLAYTGITRLPNPYIALFNDTNYAYLTWNSLLSNKRMQVETDVNFTGYTAASHFYSEKIEAYKSSYSLGPVILDIISDPRYVVGEGFGNNIHKGTVQQTAFSNLNVYQSASLPVYIKTSFSGASQQYLPGITYDHEVKLSYYDNLGNTVTLADTFFLGISQLLVEKHITSDKLQNTSQLYVSSENNFLFSMVPNQLHSTNIHYIYLKYPQNPDFLGSSEQSFFIDNGMFPKTYLDIQNVNVGSSQVILYDLTTHKYITTVVSGGNVKALIPNSASQKECFLTTTANINTVTALSPVNQTGFFVNYKTTNPDSAFLIVTHKSITNAVNYKTYRQSPAGGSHHVIMADIDDLYDQFAYGNIKNPLAIKNFCKYLSDSLPAPPKYLFLIGKSIQNDMVRIPGGNWNNCKIPTLGNPASDNSLTAGLHGANSVTPFIPVGRISVRSNSDLTHYLDKVIEHEGTLPDGLASPFPPKDWHKRVLHFSGGENGLQQHDFKTYLQIFGAHIQDTLYGARIFPFQKTTTAPIQITVSDSIKQLIDYGCSLITFFGHGSTTGFDQAIDNPAAYDNQGKYPLFLANSCYSGNIHLPDANSTSEVFTLIDKKGSIGFLASSSAGVVNTLYTFSNDFYTTLAHENYYKGVGDAIKSTAYKSSFIGSQIQEITNLEMTLEGDPSIRLNAFAKPDYEITNSSVYFNTTAHLDSIGINIVIKNNAKAINDTFIVRIQHYLPNGDSVTYFKEIQAPKNKDTLSFFIEKDYSKHVGLNHFNIQIDSYYEITELSEANNTTLGFVDLFIPGGDVVPVFPYKYAIIPNTTQITLKATTADPFALAVNYRIQLDTNDTFTSPAFTSTVINSPGGVINWNVNLPYTDSTVYFWRIRRDSLSPADSSFLWRESSFQVYHNKNGWGQSHFHQFKSDKYQFVKFKRATRRFDFENDKSSITCRNGFHRDANLSTIIPWTSINYSLNGYVMHLHPCVAFDGWTIALFDSISAQPRQSLPLPTATGTGTTSMNNCHCYPHPLNAFDYGENTFCGQSSTWQNDLFNLLDTIPVGTKVLAYSNQNHASSTFSTQLRNAFGSIGSNFIYNGNISDSIPIIIFGKKGMTPTQAHEVVGSSINSIIYLQDSIETNWNHGYIASEIIGPSSKWNSLHWRQESIEFPSHDSIKLKIVGIRANGIRDTMSVVFPKDSTDVYDLAHYIDAAVYPKMQLVAFMRDDVLKTPPQLKKWQVFFDPIPECAINPQLGFYNSSTVQAIQEGQNLVVRLPIENIGVVPFTDSLVVTYWVEDAQRIIHPLPHKLKAKPFVPNQVLIDTIRFDTFDENGINHFSGYNYLWVDVNPETHARHQLEQYHFNNIIRIGFNITKDNTNPLLDVTFDGTHILNGDIVSSKPHVLVTLKDENRYLALNDTSNFKVFIKYPNQGGEKRIYFANALQFTPAQLPSNSCKIEWRPEFAEDGKYKMIVQATDRSSNVSGSTDYNIQFEIVNKQTITEVLNYPNPFSTSTRFVFTLTGSEIPDIFTIQVMTITGKVVREINKNEMGNLHIGRNITEYAWDGKDEFGDKLANGVYLYRVITRSKGDAVEKRATDADSFFKKGVGKMVIMR